MPKLIQTPLTNVFIENYLKKYNCTYFKGVFSADTLPFNIKPPFNLIVNLSNLKDLGSHFVTISADTLNILYIDSFGLPCFIDSISIFIQHFHLPILYNTKTIQNIHSKACGYYCILFILYQNNIITKPIKWKKNTELNDNLCVTFLNDEIKTHLNATI